MKSSKLLSALLLSFFLWTSRAELHGQVGNDNPTGPSGVFNGNVTTGGSYDPYTGNAVRTITDMEVAGAVGQYGLSYSRTWNTRTPGWQHSYNWGIEDITVATNEKPEYVVNFPDGRREVFAYTASDVYYRAAPGVRERLQPWKSADGSCYLVLPDGGKIEFHGTRTLYSDSEMIPPNWYEYSFTATAIIDPYGQRTTFEYYPDGNLKKVIEPAGRSIQLFYTTVSGTQVLDYIKGSDNREAHYTYQSQTFGSGSTHYTVLTNVTYSAYYGGPDDPSVTASYTYRSPNVGDPNGPPLLSTCDDPMFAGPMKRINYTYKIGKNQDDTDAVYAQLDSEKNGNGIPVSSLDVTGTDTRKETRGDGPSRTFTYASGYLTGWTDFKGVPSSQTYDNTLYVASVTDGRGHTTNFTNNPLTGAVTQIQYPLTPNDTPPNTPRGTVNYTYGWANCPDPNNRDANNPYYLYSVKDEAGNETRFTRDSNKRITRIDYPDNAYETFSYNSFGQVLSHVMKTGGTETFTYDGRGLKQTYRDPDHATGNPTSRYQYDALDRLSGITDALGVLAGDGNHTVNYVYNTRGQLRVTTFPTDPVDSARHTVVNGYNSNGDGTLVARTDQLGHTTSYTYDDYRRIRSVTTPQRFPGDNTPRTASVSYDTYQSPWDDYTHTDANITRLTLSSGKLVKATYDANHRKTSVTASGANEITDSSTTGFEYDDAGNLSLVKEPDPGTGQASAARATSYNYDERNRPMSVTDALTRTTSLQYDQYGRRARVQDPNGQTITYDSYDPMNRLLQQTVTQAPTTSAVTKYTWWPSGLLHTMEDPNSKVYSYLYDLLGRKLSLTYPPDSGNVTRSESYTYDQVTGNLDTYTNRAGAVQTFFVDALKRPIGFDWNDGYTPQQRMQYDVASRVTQIWNWDATINYTYWDNNLLKTEQELTGYNYNHTTSYSYDADGNRQSLTCPSGKVLQYAYNNRNQLTAIGNEDWVTMVSYQYDLAGNRQQRALYNGTVTEYAPVDALNRSSWVKHSFNGTEKARFDYAFDEVNRLKYEQRNGATADGYGYDVAGQLTAFNRDGTLINGTVTGGSQVAALSYDPTGNRAQVTSNGTTTAWSVNDLNQYTNTGAGSVSSDSNGNVQSYNGWSYTYDAQNRLRVAQNGSTRLEFWYDGRNRQIARTSPGPASRPRIALAANANGLYVTAENGGNAPLIANRGAIGQWEQFERIDLGNGYIALRSMANGLYVCAENGGASPLIANRSAVGTWEQFQLVDAGGGKYALVARANGLYVCAENAGASSLIANRSAAGSWEQFSVVSLPGEIPVTRSVWDGWDLLEERDVNDDPVEYYLHGARTDELVVRWGGAYGDTWYAQDGRGNVSHLFDYAGLVERYTYGFAGEPKIFDGSGIVQTASPLQNRFMFTGREYYKEGGIYDYRNRFYHPALGRFLQTDPLGFGGGDANLYRYCGGDPINRGDPFGLESPYPTKKKDGGSDVPGYYGYDPYPGSGPLEGIDESTMNVITLGGAPSGNGPVIGPWGQQSTTGASNMGPNDHGSGSGPGDGGDSGGGGSGPSGNGPGSSPSAGTIPNPYRNSGPLIAEVWKDFDGANMQRVGDAFTYGIAYPAAAAVALPVVAPLALDGIYAVGWHGLVPAANAGMAAAYRYGPQLSQVQAFVGSIFGPTGQNPALTGSYATAEVNGWLAGQIANGSGLWDGP